MEKMDEKYMKRALALAEKGRGKTKPNPLVGAVIVKDDLIIGEGWHKYYGGNHGEIQAINDATDKKNVVRGSTLYVNLEPCSHFGKTPPCSARIIQEGIKRVVIGTVDPNPLVAGQGIKQLRQAGILVEIGVLKKEAEKLNEVFFYGICQQKPFVHYKCGMSLDGKIATRTGESQWISGEESRKKVHRLRGQYTGIMVGVDTITADNPRLTCREKGFENPSRIIMDSHLRIPLKAKVVQTAKEIPTYLVTLIEANDYPQELIDAGVKLITVSSKQGRCDLNQAMEKLYMEGIDSILLEGGPTLAEAAFREEIIQRISFFIAPIIIGGADAKTSVEGKGIGELAKAYQLEMEEVKQYGRDFLFEGVVRRNKCLLD
jgi:diaminohydroxyphosphoribosylaminopyrimidine deaminase / 5-amino-6-(5-phosphoribosylamino)uracil reductase